MVSPESKLPFKALLYRASLIWRMAELSRDAYEKFENKRLASATFDTILETVDLIFLRYFAGRIERVDKILSNCRQPFFLHEG